MWLLDFLSGKHKPASCASMMTPDADLDYHGDPADTYNTDEELEFDPFEGHTTLVYKEDGTTRFYNHKFVDANIAGGLLDADVDRFFLSSPVELKYYGADAPDVKVYLLRNRVMRKENQPLWNHFKIREKGPVLLYHMTNKPRVILPAPSLSEVPNKVYKPNALKIPTPQTASASPPIPGTFIEAVF